MEENTPMICYVHYEQQPCAQCATTSFLRRCGFATARSGHHAVIVFKEAVFDNIFAPWERSFSIDTPERLRVECEKRGVISNYLAESSLWRSGPRREV